MMKIAVVGCTHAGTAAVQEILTRHPDTIVDVFERREDIFFLSCGIALYLEGTVDKLSSMFYADAQGLEAMGPNIHVHLRHDVIKIDAKKHVLQVQNMATQSKFSQSYDKLIMTTGSYPVIPPLQGISLPRVLMCKNADDAEKKSKPLPKLPKPSPSSVVVISAWNWQKLIAGSAAMCYSSTGCMVY